jgi:hypothetical protein
MPWLQLHPAVRAAKTLIASLLADILRTLLKRIEEAKMPKPAAPTKGKYIHVDALKLLVNRWRTKAAQEEWGLAYALEECADQLENLYNNVSEEKENDDQESDERREGRHDIGDNTSSGFERGDPTEVDPQPGGPDR